MYSLAITAIALHPEEQFLFCGSVDGRIFVNKLDVGLLEEQFVVAEAQPVVLNGHK